MTRRGDISSAPSPLRSWLPRLARRQGTSLAYVLGSWCPASPYTSTAAGVAGARQESRGSPRQLSSSAWTHGGTRDARAGGPQRILARRSVPLATAPEGTQGFPEEEGERAQGEGREAPEQSLLLRSSAMAGLGAKRPRSASWSVLPPARPSGRALPQGPPPRGGTRPGSVDSYAPPRWWAAASRRPPASGPAPDPAPRCPAPYLLPAAGLTSRSLRRYSGSALRPRPCACSAPGWNIFLWPPRLQGEASQTVQRLASGVKANPRGVYLPGKYELDSGIPLTFPLFLGSFAHLKSLWFCLTSWWEPHKYAERRGSGR